MSFLNDLRDEIHAIESAVERVDVTGVKTIVQTVVEKQEETDKRQPRTSGSVMRLDGHEHSTDGRAAKKPSALYLAQGTVQMVSWLLYPNQKIRKLQSHSRDPGA